MKLNLLSRAQLDAKQWDNLVLSHGTDHVFSTSLYLDELAEQWCVLVDEQYTKGMAIPYTTRMGVRQIYTPIFCRSVFVSPELTHQEIERHVSFKFPYCEIVTSNEVGLPAGRVYQCLSSLDSFKLNEQAKRMIKKFSKSNFTIKLESKIPDEVFEFMKQELDAKGVQIDQKAYDKFKSLILRLQKEGSIDFYAVYQGENFQGGAFFLRAGKATYFLKSGITRIAKDQGAMYTIMNIKIPAVLEQGGYFDFVGSSATGVRRFNVNFGAKDVDLHEISWNHAPWWFNILKSVKKQLARRN